MEVVEPGAHQVDAVAKFPKQPRNFPLQTKILSRKFGSIPCPVICNTRDYCRYIKALLGAYQRVIAMGGGPTSSCSYDFEKLLIPAVRTRILLSTPSPSLCMCQTLSLSQTDQTHCAINPCITPIYIPTQPSINPL